MNVVEVFVATGCHLCPPTQQAAEEAAAALGATVVVTDIDGDPVLERQYRARIPVVVVNGREVGAFTVTSGEIRAALRGSS